MQTTSLKDVPPGLGFRRYLRKPHLRDRIYAFLTSELFQLDPGERFDLTEKTLAQVLGVPRSAVREALARLASEGAIDVRPGVGVVAVNPDAVKIDTETLGHYYAIRKLIECRNARIAATAENENLEDSLRDAFLAMEGAQRELASLNFDRTSPEFGDLVNRLVGYDVRFHSLIAEVTGADFIQDLLEMLLALMLPHRRLSLDEPGRLAETIEEHRAILDRIQAHDPDGAAKAMENHIDQVSRVRTRRREGSQQDEAR